jgi:hypothetical protein
MTVRVAPSFAEQGRTSPTFRLRSTLIRRARLPGTRPHEPAPPVAAGGKQPVEPFATVISILTWGDCDPRMDYRDCLQFNGQGGIRTLDTLAGIPVFETGSFSHSDTCPRDAQALAGGKFSTGPCGFPARPCTGFLPRETCDSLEPGVR